MNQRGRRYIYGAKIVFWVHILRGSTSQTECHLLSVSRSRPDLFGGRGRVSFFLSILNIVGGDSDGRVCAHVLLFVSRKKHTIGGDRSAENANL